MMNSSNSKIGYSVEKLVSAELRKRHYWVYNTPNTMSGQPVDIIAISEHSANPIKIFLIDAKNVNYKQGSFPLSRIEPNQWSTMDYARGWCGIKYLGFAIKFEKNDEIFWLSYDLANTLKQQGYKSVKIEQLQTFKEVLDKHENSNQ